RPIDPAWNPVAELGVLLALLGPEHLLDRILERSHPRLDRRARFEMTDGVVQEKWRGRPEADERGRPGIATPAGRHHVAVRRAGVRVIPGDLADRWQLFVGLGRKVVPDVAADRVRRQ